MIKKLKKNNVDGNGGIEGGDCLYNLLVLLRREKDQHHQQRSDHRKLSLSKNSNLSEPRPDQSS